jgi:hypothetical protein
MPENEARAWWADVQHVRESIERRRGAAVETTAPPDPASARRFTRAAAEPPVPRLDELDWPDELPGAGTRRFERAAPPERADRSSGSSDDARISRRHAAASEPARRRRPRAELDVGRPRSHRPDDGRPSARVDAAAIATPAATGPASADATPPRASAAMDVDFERAPAPAPAPRRTVQITGRTVPAPRLVEIERRRPGRRPAERVGPRPDRIALYAVLLGFFLILVAATSAHAAI